MTKSELRNAMRYRNRQLSSVEKHAAAERIFADVETLPAFGRARCVACFCALPDEPPTDAVLHRWSLDRRVVVPRVEGDAMRFYDYRPEALVCGAFGIEEPAVAGDADIVGSLGIPDADDVSSAFRECRSFCALCPPEAIDLLIVPGVAFTSGGARLGRGKGYYDRYLGQAGLRAFRVGVCFAHQIVGDLPVEPHDCPMDAVCFG